jgi:uncharacterized protein YbjT (DUF2867 family)
MKIIIIGATGTIGSEVVKALLQNKHEVVRASRNGEVKVNLDDPASIGVSLTKFKALTRSSPAPETLRSSLSPN